MKKIKNKELQDKIAKKHYIHELKRKDKHYTGEKKQHHPEILYTTIPTPKRFSLIENCDDALSFFEDFMSLSDKANYLKVDMSKTEELTTEVLLYLISLHKINKANNTAPNIIIKAPDKYELRYLMTVSGFSNYFKSKSKVKINNDDIFKIRDKHTNTKKGIQDAKTCQDAVDFALKFFPGAKFTDDVFFEMFNALAEMMTNTDNHAYDEDGVLRNWYLFGSRIDGGVAFFFFDNGKGIIKTAKKNLIEKALNSINFSLKHKNIMRSVLNGEYRSATGKPYRNKGVPEINAFLTRIDVKYPIILTNKIYTLPQKRDGFAKTKHNFKGTLFTWIITTQEENDEKH